MTYSIQTPNCIQASLPHAVNLLDQSALLELRAIRHHINALEAQSYFNQVAAMFDQHPDLIEIRMENTYDIDDNHRTVFLITEDASPGSDVSKIDNALSECADMLNHHIRHRGIYDYIDALVGSTHSRLIARSTVQNQISKAFDSVNEPGAWASSRAHLNASHLHDSTQAAAAPSSRPRI